MAMKGISRFGRKALIAALCLCACAGSAGAQNNLENMRKEYEGGNRKPAFLKEYVSALKTSDTASIAPVLDEYLMLLPPAERYGSANLADVTAYMDSPDSRVIADIALNWDKVPHEGEQGKALGDKITHIFSSYLFETVRAMKEGEKVEPRGYSALLGGKSTPFPAPLACLMEIWPSYLSGDTDKMIAGLEKLLTLPDQLTGLPDLFVLAEYLNTVLENAGLAQSRKMVVLLEDAAGRYSDGHYSSILRPVAVNFEGKIMMIESGEE